MTVAGTEVEEAFSYIESFTNLERNSGGSMRPYRLDRMTALLELFNHPERSFRTIHIAGSKGKGSTAAFLSSILACMGERTGVYTSPHVSSYRERIRLADEEIPDDIYSEIVDKIRLEISALSPGTLPGQDEPTTFELLTLLSYLTFQRLGCTWAVIETGIGGRLDATNVLQPEAVVITPIEHEHVEVLGYSAAKIAWEKAGIIKPGIPSFGGYLGREAESVVRGVARKRGSSLSLLREVVASIESSVDLAGTSVHTRWKEGGESRHRLSMIGNFQAENATLAELVIRKLVATELPEDKGEVDRIIHQGLLEAKLPGRMELVPGSPPILLDAAHTSGSALRLLETYRELCTKPGILIFGSVLGKNASAMAEIMGPQFEKVVVSTPGSFKQSNPEQVLEEFLRHNKHSYLESDPKEALRLARDFAGHECSILVAGSFYMVAEIRKLLQTGD